MRTTGLESLLAYRTYLVRFYRETGHRCTVKPDIGNIVSSYCIRIPLARACDMLYVLRNVLKQQQSIITRARLPTSFRYAVVVDQISCNNQGNQSQGQDKSGLDAARFSPIKRWANGKFQDEDGTNRRSGRTLAI